MATAAFDRIQRTGRWLMGAAALLALACTGTNPAFVEPADGAAAPPRMDARYGDVASAFEGGISDAPVTMDGEPPISDAPVDPPGSGATDAGVDSPLAEGDASDASASDGAPDTGSATGCSADPTLILCLDFEGQASDQSPNRLVMTASNLQFEPGIDGQAGLFSPDSRVEVRPNPLLDADAVTIEAWIRPNVLPTGSARMGIVDYTREYALFLHPNGDIDCIAVTDDGSVTLRFAAGVQAGLWSSVGCRMNGGSLGVLVNGEERSSRSIDGLDPSGSTDTLVVGGNFSASNPDPFEGAIDNVRIWRTFRSSVEICAGAGPLCRPSPSP